MITLYDTYLISCTHSFTTLIGLEPGEELWVRDDRSGSLKKLHSNVSGKVELVYIDDEFYYDESSSRLIIERNCWRYKRVLLTLTEKEVYDGTLWHRCMTSFASTKSLRRFLETRGAKVVEFPGNVCPVHSPDVVLFEAFGTQGTTYFELPIPLALRLDLIVEDKPA